MMRAVLAAGGLAMAIAGGFGSNAQAQSVLNGGFELDDTFGNTVIVSPPTDWTVGGGGNAGVESSDPHSGLNDAFLTNDLDTGLIPSTLSQTISGLVIGDQYTVDFFLDADAETRGDPTATFDAALGDQDLIGGPIDADALAIGYNEFPDTLTADATSAELLFTANSSNGDFYLDDVSISAVGVPEPISALVFASAIGAFTLLRRRRT